MSQHISIAERIAFLRYCRRIRRSSIRLALAAGLDRRTAARLANESIARHREITAWTLLALAAAKSGASA